MECRKQLWWFIFSFVGIQGSASICSDIGYLVNGVNGVLDSAMSASRVWSTSTSFCGAYLARLHAQPYYDGSGTEYNSWCPPSNTQTDYLQVQFETLKTVHAILTQGRAQSPGYPQYSFYTKSYLVRFSLDGIGWTDVEESGSAKVFLGNTDRDTVVTNYLPTPVDAFYIRIVPQSWEISICLRIDILGCDANSSGSGSENVTNTKVTSGGNYWGYAGIATNGTPTNNVAMELTAKSVIKCIVLCSENSDCLSASYAKETQQCTGYSITNLMGDFTPSDPNINSPQDYVSLYFNYDYASAAGFTSDLSLGVSYRIPYTQKTQQEAESQCGEWGSRLITIMFNSQLSALQTHISGDSVLTATGRLYVSGMYNGGSQWIYPSGNTVPNSFWMFGEPNFAVGNCVVLTTSGLASWSCDDSLFFICSLL